MKVSVIEKIIKVKNKKELAGYMYIADWRRGQQTRGLGQGMGSREDRNTGDTWLKANMRPEG